MMRVFQNKPTILLIIQQLQMAGLKGFDCVGEEQMGGAFIFQKKKVPSLCLEALEAAVGSG